MCVTTRLLLGLLCAGCALASLAQTPPASQCPQPRFTGRAPEPYYTARSPLPDNRDLGAAEKLFNGGADGKLGCAACHGASGGGDGPLAGQFDPRPRNFRCAETIRGVPDGQLFWIIRFGSPGTSMPAHRNFTDDDIWTLVAYVRQLAK
jgi:mono/diheme cytochrome c family protein